MHSILAAILKKNVDHSHFPHSYTAYTLVCHVFLGCFTIPLRALQCFPMLYCAFTMHYYILFLHWESFMRVHILWSISEVYRTLPSLYRVRVPRLYVLFWGKI